MIRHIVVTFPLLLLFVFKSQSQRVIEFGIKPTEWAFRNFEAYAGTGTKNLRYGLILSFRPATKNSGTVPSGGSGMAGGYGHRYLNRLYTSYTLGVYHKRYIGATKTGFIEADIFYRNWHFSHKQARFDEDKYSFDGERTERINVYGLKLLAGQTFMLSKRAAGYNLYLDIYLGAGIRYQDGTYETFNGLVNEIYYDYKKEHISKLWPTPQFGIKVGLLK
jgi:hypothetical protein